MAQKSADYSRRLASIDHLRALAVISMMVAHFGPGVVERLPKLSPIADLILFWGKFATVTFILVFGVTVGFVYYERFHSDDRAKTVSRILMRFRLILLCAVIICIPSYFSIWHEGTVTFANVLSKTYSVLNFYVVALLLTPLWLIALGRRPFRNAMILSLAHWAVAMLLLAVWQSSDVDSIAEWIRINIVSGPYAYLQLAAWTLIAVPFGVYLRRCLRDGAWLRLALRMLPLGVMLTLGGWMLGHLVDEFDLHAIVEGTVKSPPRLWYWMFFSGPALVLLLGLVAVEIYLPRVCTILYPLALFGQGALPIYTAHAFVLPALALLDKLVVIEGAGRIGVSLSILLVLCLTVIHYYHRKRSRQVFLLARAASE